MLDSGLRDAQSVIFLVVACDLVDASEVHGDVDWLIVSIDGCTEFICQTVADIECLVLYLKHPLGHLRNVNWCGIRRAPLWHILGAGSARVVDSESEASERCQLLSEAG